MRSIALVGLLTVSLAVGCGGTNTPPDIAADERFEQTLEDLSNGVIEVRVEGSKPGPDLISETCEYRVRDVRRDTIGLSRHSIVVEIETLPTSCR